MLQIVISLTDNSRGIIYKRKMFIVQATLHTLWSKLTNFFVIWSIVKPLNFWHDKGSKKTVFGGSAVVERLPHPYQDEISKPADAAATWREKMAKR